MSPVRGASKDSRVSVTGLPDTTQELMAAEAMYESAKIAGVPEALLTSLQSHLRDKRAERDAQKPVGARLDSARAAVRRKELAVAKITKQIERAQLQITEFQDTLEVRNWELQAAQETCRQLQAEASEQIKDEEEDVDDDGVDAVLDDVILEIEQVETDVATRGRLNAIIHRARIAVAAAAARAAPMDDEDDGDCQITGDLAAPPPAKTVVPVVPPEDDRKRTLPPDLQSAVDSLFLAMGEGEGDPQVLASMAQHIQEVANAAKHRKTEGPAVAAAAAAPAAPPS